jgi:hypothetical protein
LEEGRRAFAWNLKKVEAEEYGISNRQKTTTFDLTLTALKRVKPNNRINIPRQHRPPDDDDSNAPNVILCQFVEGFVFNSPPAVCPACQISLGP